VVMRSVTSVCVSVMLTFESLDLESSLGVQVIYQGHMVKVASPFQLFRAWWLPAAMRFTGGICVQS